MSTIPEPGLRVANVLLDSVTAWDDGQPAFVNEMALNMAVAQINEIDGAVIATMDSNGGLTVDVSNVLGGAAATLNWAVRLLAHERGVQPVDVVADLRERLESD